MEFKVKPSLMPVIEWNFEELKAELNEQMKKYSSIVYTEDNIKEAKEDRAKLNKLVKEMNAKKIDVKNEYCYQYFVFEDQVKELQGIVQNTVSGIDDAVKNYESKLKAVKREECILLYKTIFAEWLDNIPFELIEQPRWYNMTTSMKAIENEMKAKALTIAEDIRYITKQPKATSILFDYYSTLNLQIALSKNQERLEWEKKQQEEQQPADQNEPMPIIDKSDWYEITLRVKVNDLKLDSLLAYISASGIELLL